VSDSNDLHDVGYYYVETASYGVKALQKLTDGGFDCIITDWNMPKMNGFEFVKAIKANTARARLPILVVTTRGLEEEIKRMLKMGVASSIVKPFKAGLLKEKLDDIFAVESKTL